MFTIDPVAADTLTKGGLGIVALFILYQIVIRFIDLIRAINANQSSSNALQAGLVEILRKTDENAGKRDEQIRVLKEGLDKSTQGLQAVVMSNEGVGNRVSVLSDSLKQYGTEHVDALAEKTTAAAATVTKHLDERLDAVVVQAGQHHDTLLNTLRPIPEAIAALPDRIVAPITTSLDALAEALEAVKTETAANVQKGIETLTQIEALRGQFKNVQDQFALLGKSNGAASPETPATSPIPAEGVKS